MNLVPDPTVVFGVSVSNLSLNPMVGFARIWAAALEEPGRLERWPGEQPVTAKQRAFSMLCLRWGAPGEGSEEGPGEEGFS